jgi:hypothetical protein
MNRVFLIIKMRRVERGLMDPPRTVQAGFKSGVSLLSRSTMPYDICAVMT